VSLQATRPSSTRDLSPCERSFVTVLQQLGFGHLESLQIRCGAVVLDPSPTVVQVLKFGAPECRQLSRPVDFELKKSVVDLFEYIRGVDAGEIRRLEVRHGLPFSMEIERRIPRGMSDVKGEHVEAV
jgi:hypothetical protein